MSEDSPLSLENSNQNGEEEENKTDTSPPPLPPRPSKSLSSVTTQQTEEEGNRVTSPHRPLPPLPTNNSEDTDSVTQSLPATVVIPTIITTQHREASNVSLPLLVTESLPAHVSSNVNAQNTSTITNTQQLKEESQIKEEAQHGSSRVIKRTNAVRKKSHDKPLVTKRNNEFKRSSSSPDILEEASIKKETSPLELTKERQKQTTPPCTRVVSPLVTSSLTHQGLTSDTLGLDDLDPAYYGFSLSEDNMDDDDDDEQEVKSKLPTHHSDPNLPSNSSPYTNVQIKRFMSYPSNISDNSSFCGYQSDNEDEANINNNSSSYNSNGLSTRLHSQEMLNELFFKFKKNIFVSKKQKRAPRQRSATETSIERIGRASGMILSRHEEVSGQSDEGTQSEKEEEPEIGTPTLVPHQYLLEDLAINVKKTKKTHPKKTSVQNFSPMSRKTKMDTALRKSRTYSVDLSQRSNFDSPDLIKKLNLKPISPVMERRPLSPRPQKIKKFKLHDPRTPEKLLKHLRSGQYDQVERNERGDTALHAIIRSDRKDKIDYVRVLMVHSDYGTENIDVPDLNGNTALHLAVQKADLIIVQFLLVFGANIDALNSQKKTPLDTLANKGGDRKFLEIITLFQSLDAKHGPEVIPVEHTKHHTTRLMSISLDLPELQERMVVRTTVGNSMSRSIEKPRALSNDALSPAVMAQKLETNLNELYAEYDRIFDIDIQLAIGLQQFELHGWKKTSSSAIKFNVQGGSRILFLDGGGIRGLIQIEVMSIIEQRTGRSITELFDWIVGTSTGGIVALGLVYAKKTLAELRQFYFKLKEDVFTTQGIGGLGGFNTDELERILKDVLGTKMRMSDVREPKILISGVNKKFTNLDLVFFNNCLDDEFSNELVWKVARYTSAAPGYFTECDDYVDGGVLANNPTDYGLTAIQNFHRQQGRKLDMACVVSIGTGIFPAAKLGRIDDPNIIKRAKYLLTLLARALVDSENVAINCKSRCEEQRIPFFRFSPNLDSEIQPGETDDYRLTEMLMRTKHEAVENWSNDLDELTYIFTRIEEYSHKEKVAKLRQRRRGRITDHPSIEEEK